MYHWIYYMHLFIHPMWDYEEYQKDAFIKAQRKVMTIFTVIDFSNREKCVLYFEDIIQI